MNKVRYVSSPNMDDILTPDTPRRYYNQIFGWFFFLLVCFSVPLGMFFFKNIPFFKILLAVIRHDYEYLSYFNMSIFFGKCFFVFVPSILLSWFLTSLITKPITRQVHVSGNFLDTSPEIFKNYESDFYVKNGIQDIAMIREGELDFNSCGKTKPLPKDGVPIKDTVYYSSNILELSSIIRGEAGSGKSVLLNRFIKEAIDNKHKVILHSIKGDEIEMLNGYCDFYLIQPWESRGYALDFLNMVVSKVEQREKASIRTLVESFSQAKAGKEDFFDKGSIAVLEGLVRCVVSTTKQNGIVQGDLGDIVNLWNGFQVNPINEDIDVDDYVAVKNELSKNNQQLEVIKQFLLEWNKPAVVYVDPQNAKTSLCVLASCAETIRKFEVLSSFWTGRKTLNIRKWLKTDPTKDRKVIILVNSNQFKDVANSYISAFINLIVGEVIEESYRVKHQLHFTLDEFPQLSAIKIEEFLKLPDVGRGKGIRVRVALQRTSQIKSSFNMDGKSFAGAFQHKIWCRLATDDLGNLEEEVGKKEIIDNIISANYTAQGKTISTKTEKKKVDVLNSNDLQNILGPVGNKEDKSFVGVRVLFNFSNNPRIGVCIMPPVQFKKKDRKSKIKISSGSGGVHNSESTSESDKEEKIISQEVIQELETIHNDPSSMEVESGNPVSSAVGEIGAHAVGGEMLGLAVQTGELIEAFETHSLNNNTTHTNETESYSKVKSKLDEIKKKASLRKETLSHDGDLDL